MTRRLVLCEGPDDVAALREIALRRFGAASHAHRTVGSAGRPTGARLSTPAGVALDILCPGVDEPKGKSALPTLLARRLHLLDGQTGGSDGTELVAVVYDPDAADASRFVAEVLESIGRIAPERRLDVRGSHWWDAVQEADIVAVHVVGWRSPGEILDGLPDSQSLERMMSEVAGRAYPDLRTVVERWLTEMSARHSLKVSWKSAVHLWCAMVEAKADEHNAPARFLGQNKLCDAHVGAVLSEASLLSDLRPLLGDPDPEPPAGELP